MPGVMDDDLYRFDEEGWTPPAAITLYHGTSSTFLPSIRSEGIRAASHWGTERVARYFARANCDEHGGEPVLFGLRLDALDQGLIRPDDAMIEFPIFPDYDERQYEWEEKSKQGWAESLRLYEALIYAGPIDWRLLRTL